MGSMGVNRPANKETPMCARPDQQAEQEQEQAPGIATAEEVEVCG